MHHPLNRPKTYFFQNPQNLKLKCCCNYFRAQTIMKARLKGAQTGRNLLKKKADALMMRFRQILKRIIETKTLMGEVMREASLSLAEAKFTMGDFSQQILQNVGKAAIKVGCFFWHVISATPKYGKFFLIPVLYKACSKMKSAQWGFHLKNS